MLTLTDVSLRLGTVDVLQGLHLRLNAGERLALLGPSGCGKSSVLRLLAGLLTPSSGALRFDAGRPPRWGCVFQQATLMPWARTLDNVALPLRLQGLGAAAARERASAQMARVGLAGFERAHPHELSGGMQMRAALARAMVTEPEALLLDEPFGALDEITRERLGQELLARCAEQPALAVVLVTHSVFEAVSLADRIVILSPRPGRVLAELDVAGQRPPSGWAQSDAYFGLVRQAQEALARGMRQEAAA
ncbi:MAG: ABC transporter ATP-binding protein [Inhella sp.]|jgi:NitT/TauT family transport system ATP-binding protein|uniref:ABC transporter ATP-binding protein n=1 Tax=Inhella sp. TaxID=1921806 RepID=UPI0022C908EB|nr:ABC transporter ATP-binding protein [Inhella sp.]MCZ8233749.1 ABC transporter ATP-binding protein [Inhella sp.]